jgi:hypothetical protein
MALTSFCNAQDTRNNSTNLFFGIWTNNTYGIDITLILNENKTGEFDGNSFTFEFTETILTFSDSQGDSKYTYQLNNDILTLTGLQQGEGTYTFTRLTGTKKPTNSQSNEQITQNNKTQTSTTIDKSLIGKWTGNGETIEFLEGGKCNYYNTPMTYEVKGASILLNSGQGIWTLNYVIKGDQLNLEVNGKQFIYTKGNGTANNVSTTNNGNKRVAAELVGKWCWTNVTSTNSGGTTSEKCIVLNGDGTYTYNSSRSMDTNTDTFYGGTNSRNSDRGTWTADGQNIYYSSQTGQGTGSYKLEKRNHPKNGDPMIVLDGETYVTYYQKNPW